MQVPVVPDVLQIATSPVVAAPPRAAAPPSSDFASVLAEQRQVRDSHAAAAGNDMRVSESTTTLAERDRETATSEETRESRARSVDQHTAVASAMAPGAPPASQKTSPLVVTGGEAEPDTSSLPRDGQATGVAPVSAVGDGRASSGASAMAGAFVPETAELAAEGSLPKDGQATAKSGTAPADTPTQTVVVDIVARSAKPSASQPDSFMAYLAEQGAVIVEKAGGQMALAGSVAQEDVGAEAVSRLATDPALLDGKEESNSVKNSAESGRTGPSKSPATDGRLSMSVGQAQDSAQANPTGALHASRGAEPVVPATLDDLAIRGIRYLVSHGERTITIRLVPPSLGELRLEVTSAGDAVNVRMISANATVRELLEGHAQGLRDALGRNGIEAASVMVLAAMPGHASGEYHPGNASPDFGVLQTPPLRFDAPLTESDAPVRKVAPHSGLLNIFV